MRAAICDAFNSSLTRQSSASFRILREVFHKELRIQLPAHWIGQRSRHLSASAGKSCNMTRDSSEQLMSVAPMCVLSLFSGVVYSHCSSWACHSTVPAQQAPGVFCHRILWPVPYMNFVFRMDWTDVHFRQLARLLSTKVWLWTEMVVGNTITHTDNLDSHLWFPQEQHPIVLQVGGSDPDVLREAARKAAVYGYDEINLNCGCPSDRVAGAGCFGATMMLQPMLVAQCAQAIADGAPEASVTVKCRIGVDDVDDYASLHTFVRTVASNSPVQHFVVHARKCLLKGLSPHQNRTIPPLRYDWVFALKRDFPHLQFSLNGGIQSCEEVNEILATKQDAAAVHGVMLGRAAFNMPWHVLGCADTRVFGCDTDPAISRRQVIDDYSKYADKMIGRWYVKEDGYANPSTRTLLKPLLNLFHGERKGKRWKVEVDQYLKENPSCRSLSEVMHATLSVLDDDVLDAPPSSISSPFEPFSAEQTGSWPPQEMPNAPGHVAHVPCKTEVEPVPQQAQLPEHV